MNDDALKVIWSDNAQTDSSFTATYEEFKSAMNQSQDFRNAVYEGIRERDNKATATNQEWDEYLGFNSITNTNAVEESEKPAVTTKSTLRNEAYSTLSDDDLQGKYNDMLKKAEQRKKEAIEKAKNEQIAFAKEKPLLHAISQIGQSTAKIPNSAKSPIELMEQQDVSWFLDENDKKEYSSLRDEIGVRNYESGYYTIKKSTEEEESRVKNIRSNAELNGTKLTARDKSMLRKAEEINRDARELVEAGSKFGNESGIENWADALGNTLIDRDMVIGVGLIRDIKVDNMVEKFNNKEKLSEAEEALLLAAYNFEEVAKTRSFDLSTGYKIGQGTAESIPFIVDMMLTKGLIGGGKTALLKFFASKGKDVAKLARVMDVSLDGSKVVRATTGEKILHGAYELGETAVQTAMMPSSLRQMQQEKTEIRKETGKNDISLLDNARIFGNAYVQTFTERQGGQLIDWGLGKMIPAGNLLARYGYKEGVMKSLNEIIQQPVSEVGEGYLEASINFLRSLDLFNLYADEWDEDMRNEALAQFSKEGFVETVGSTLPISLLGGAANAVSVKTATNRFNKSHIAFGKMLEEAGATNAQSENILAQIEHASSQEEFNERLSAAKGFLKKHIQETETDLGIANTKMQNIEKIIDNYNNSATTFNNAIKDLRKLYAEMPQEKKDAMKADFENMRRKLNESITMTQQPEGPAVIHKKPDSGWKKRTMSVKIDGKNTKVTFSGDVVFSEDGSINTSLSNMDNFRLQNDKGQNVRTTVKGEEAKQKKFDTYLDAVNNALREEKTEKDKKIAEQKAAEEAIKAERKRRQEEEKKKMEEENARIEAQKQAIAQQEADRQNIIASFPKDKNGEVDIDKMSPEQFFVYESDTDSPEAAMNTVGDVLNDLYQQLEANANETNREKRARNAAKMRNRIRQYEAVVVKYAGQETLDKINAARAEALQLDTPPVQEGAPVEAAPVVEPVQGDTNAEPTVAPEQETPQDDVPAEPDTTPLPPAEPVVENGEVNEEEKESINLLDGQYAIVSSNSTRGREQVVKVTKNEDGTETWTSIHDGSVISQKANKKQQFPEQDNMRVLGIKEGNEITPVIVLSGLADLSQAKGELKVVPVNTKDGKVHEVHVSLLYKPEADGGWALLKGVGSRVLSPAEAAKYNSLDALLDFPIIPNVTVGNFTLRDMLEYPTLAKLKSRLEQLGIEYDKQTINTNLETALARWRELVRENNLNEEFKNNLDKLSPSTLATYKLYRAGVEPFKAGVPVADTMRTRSNINLYVQLDSIGMLPNNISNPLAQLAVLAEVASDLGIIQKKAKGRYIDAIAGILEKTQKAVEANAEEFTGERKESKEDNTTNEKQTEQPNAEKPKQQKPKAETKEETPAPAKPKTNIDSLRDAFVEAYARTQNQSYNTLQKTMAKTAFKGMIDKMSEEDAVALYLNLAMESAKSQGKMQEDMVNAAKALIDSKHGAAINAITGGTQQETNPAPVEITEEATGETEQTSEDAIDYEALVAERNELQETIYDMEDDEAANANARIAQINEILRNRPEFMVGDVVTEHAESTKRIIKILKDAGIRVITFKNEDLPKYVSKKKLEELSDGQIIYGFASNDTIYLNEDHFNPNSPLHEFTHLWVTAYKQAFPNEWKRFVEIANKSALAANLRKPLKDGKENPYAKLNADEMASEVLSRYTGYLYGELDAEGRTAFENMMQAQTMEEKLAEKSLLKRIRDFWKKVISFFDKSIENEKNEETIDDMIRRFAQAPMKTLARGREAVDELMLNNISENLDNSEKSSTFADRRRMTANLTQNAQGLIENRVGASNERDITDFRNALETLRTSTNQEELGTADATIKRIYAKRKAQMQLIVEEALKGIDGIRLVGIHEGTGIFEGVEEYSSRVELEVEEGAEDTAVAIMTALGEAMRQDAVIVNYEEGHKKPNGKQRGDEADKVSIKLKRPLTTKEIADLVKLLGDVTITDDEIFMLYWGDNPTEFYNNTLNQLEEYFHANQKRTEQRAVGEDAHRGVEEGTRSQRVQSPLGESFLGIHYSNYIETDDKTGRKRPYTETREQLKQESQDGVRVQNEVIDDIIRRVENILNQEEEHYIEREQIIAEAKANGTYMLAPNGKPTNLTEDMWVTVRTQAFKDWFGDWQNDPANASKVLDENGEPLVVYHGSKMAGFDEFQQLDESVNGFFTTDNKAGANTYATNREERRNNVMADEAQLNAEPHHGIYSLFANIKNPAVYDFAGKMYNEYGEPQGYYVEMSGEEWDMLPVPKFATEEEALAFARENGEPDSAVKTTYLSTDDLVEMAKAAGHDGVIFKNVLDGAEHNEEQPVMNDYIAFEPNQLKSATQNIGTFNPEDNRIEFMIGSAIDAKQKAGIEKASNKLVKGIAANVPLPERMTLLGKLWSEASDSGEVFREILKALREFNAKNGLSRKLPEGSDVRQVYTNSMSVLANKLKELANMYEKPLRKNLEELIEIVKVSSMYEKYKKEMRTVEEETIKEDGTVTTVLKKIEHELTPREFIERYLIACDNIERYQNGIPTRGIAVFKQWMGVDIIEFQTEFEAVFGASKEGEALLKNLWKSINDYTNYTLEDSFNSDMLTPEEYYKRKNRKFYIPERDFAIDKDLEQPEVAPKSRYKSNKLSSSIKAKGGRTLAANIIENMIYIGNTDLYKNNKNRVKVAMWNLLQNNPEFRVAIGLPKPEEVWYDKDGKRVTNAPTKEEREHMRLVQEDIFNLEYLLEEELDKEEEMQDTAEINSLKRELDKLYKERDDIPYMLEYEASRRFMSENDPNLVGVYINGTMCSMSFPNMPLAAVALNDTWDKEPQLPRLLRWIKGHVSSVITATEPLFFLKNVPADGMSIVLKGAVQYGSEFSLRYIATAKDILKHGKLVGTYVSGGDYRSLEYGELFRDFLMNGGNTGYTTTRNMEKILKELEYLDRGHSSIEEAMKQSKKSLTFMNECTELLLRFATYKTAIDMGKGVDEATNAANNLSANFNRSGKPVPLSENVGLHTKLIVNFMRYFKEFSMFYNPAVQGAMQFFRMFGESGALDTKEKIERWTRIFTNAMFLPALTGFLNAMIFRDDDEEEWAVSEYDRANYFIIGKNGKFTMGHMTRPFYNIGVNIALHMQGRRDGGKIADSILTSFLTHLTPCAPSLSNMGVTVVHNVFGQQELRLWDFLQSFTTPEALAVFNEAADGVNFMGQKIKYDDEKTAMYTKNPNAGAAEKLIAEMLFWLGGGEWGGVTTLKENGNGDVHSMFNVTPNEVRKALSLLLPKTAIDIANVSTGAVLNVIDKSKGEYIDNNIRLSDLPIINTFISERTPEAYRNGIYSEANKIARANKLVMDKAYKEMVRISIKMNNELSDEEYRDLEKRYAHFEAIYNQAAGDSIAGAIREILPAYKEVRFSNIQKKFSMNEKELRKSLSDLDYDSLEESERELIFNMSQLVQMEKGCGPINSKIPQWMKGVFGIEPTSAEVQELWDTYEEYIEK